MDDRPDEDGVRPFQPGDRVWAIRDCVADVLELDLPEDLHRPRVAHWMSSRGIRIPVDHLDVLAYCESGAELWFALGWLRGSTWKREGERSLTDGRYRLAVQEPIGPYRVDFLADISADPGFHRVVEIDGPYHFTPEAEAADRERDARLRQLGYPVVHIPAAVAKRGGETFRAALVYERRTWVPEQLVERVDAAVHGVAENLTRCADAVQAIPSWLRKLR